MLIVFLVLIAFYPHIEKDQYNIFIKCLIISCIYHCILSYKID